MAATAPSEQIFSPSTSRSLSGERPADSLRFDLLAAVLIAWFIGGLFLDGWAHNNGRVDDTFFTPWHLVLYSGFGAVGLLTAGTHFRNVFRGYRWTRALPQGYMLSLVGVAIFAVGGGFDFWWHSTFGFEVDTEALLSPAHLLLATGAILFVTGPLRAAWNRATPAQGWRDLLPAILSLLYVLCMLTFFTQYSHVMNAPQILAFRPRGGDKFFFDLFGILGLMLPAALTMGVVLFAIRRWRLPFGSLTLMITVNVTLMLLMNSGDAGDFPALLLVGPLTGLLADALLRQLKPSAENIMTLRLFAFVVPFVMTFMFLFLLNGATARGLWWQIHMWLGVPLSAGAAGLFLSYLTHPPALPQVSEE